MKPFLKWAGGKYKIIGHIAAHLPTRACLIEPFVGSGAVFLNTDFDAYVLADTNADLINLYKKVQADGRAFARYASSLFVPENNEEEAYYARRAEFNETQDADRKAALFVYLNRHCFNGLCRYNAQGKFNVPFGRYTKPTFPTAEVLNFHEKSKRATFHVADFRETMEKASASCVVYCDPPYAPLTPTANFSSYTEKGFGQKDQEDLAKLAAALKAKDIPVVISNHDTRFTREIYARAKITSFDVQRFISSDGKNRDKAAEILAVYA